MSDFRHGLRLLVARPAFAALAIATQALGIGANTAIFSAVTALLWRPLPVADAGRVVHGVSLREGFDPFAASLLEYAAQRRSSAFASTAVTVARTVTLVGHDEPERLHAAGVSAGFFSTLGTGARAGRTFAPGEDGPEAPPIAVIGYDLWQRRFGGSASVIGARITLDADAYTIVGIMPRGFDLPARTALWVPLRINVDTAPLEQLRVRGYDLFARLAPGVTVEQADTESRRLAKQLERDWPALQRGWTFKVLALRQYVLSDLAGRNRRALLILEVAVGFLLLICCANVANLLLVSGVAREREIAVRLALGAARARVVRQLLAESAILALAGGAAGVLVAGWMLPVLTRINPIHATALAAVLGDFSIDRRVLLFSTAASLATGLLFGLAPALRTSRAGDLVAALKQREQRFGSAAGRRWLGAIVVVEMATAVVLLVNGALIVQSFMRLQRVELGFDPSRLMTLEFTPVPARVTGHDDRVRYVDDIVARVRALPGVAAAGITSNYPLQTFSSDSTFTVEGRPPANPADVPITAHRLVTADYLQTLGVRLLRGRLLDGHDRAGSLPVVVVSEELARQAWPGADPIGKRIRRGRLDDASNPWMTVVGVVADVKEDAFNFRINRPAWYLPYAQVSSASVTHNVVVRATPGVDPTAVAHDVVAAVRSVEPQQAVSDVSTMTAHVADLLVTERFSATLMTTFAAVGLFLAACGLAGVIAYSVSQRTGEIGLRMALGATGRDVLAMILREGAVLIAIGIAIGGAAARTLALALGGMLYGVHPGDPRTFLIVSAVLIVVSLAACGVPALRAMRVEPLVALKSE